MPKRSPVTIKDIAKASGVSYPTVSHVLNNSRSVSEETRDRVMEAIRRLNYHPNAVARGLLKRRMNTIGVVLPDSSDFLTVDPYLGPILEGILKVARDERQTAMLFTNVQVNGKASPADIPLYCDGRCDGIIFIHIRTDDPVIEMMGDTGVPFVCVNEVCEPTTAAAIDAAQVEGARELAGYLFERGHRRIVLLAGKESIRSCAQRHQGFLQAAPFGLGPHDFPLLAGDFTMESGYQRTLTLMQQAADRPTALYCFNDLIALGAIRALTELGLAVPEDVSVVGFDDIPAATTSRPGLTTMRLPFREEGMTAAQMLLERLEHPERTSRQVFLPMTLVERQSVRSFVIS